MFSYINDNYRKISRLWRNNLSEILQNGDFEHLKLNRSKGEAPNKYQISAIARRKRYLSGDESQESGGLNIGRNQLLINVRGPCYSDTKMELGFPDFSGLKNPIMLKAGSNLRKLGKFYDLENRINKIGESYRSNFSENIYDFLKEIVKESNNYITNLKK